jgi:hypothetical protein
MRPRDALTAGPDPKRPSGIPNKNWLYETAFPDSGQTALASIWRSGWEATISQTE